MQIDRSNYEIWFIDWLDGNLNSLQVEQLKIFLDHNPDLREELDDLTHVNLVAPHISFRQKEHLKKSPSDISPTQFEYLCAAYLENDLNYSQKAELKEIINTFPDKKKIFDLIRRTILTPERISYRHKSLLHKITTRQKVMRVSLIGLCSAAAISLIIIIYSVITGPTSLKPDSSAHNIVPDTTFQRPSPGMAAARIITDSIPVPADNKRENRFADIHNKDNIVTNQDMIIALSNDSLIRRIENQEMAVKKVPVHTHFDLRKGIISNTIIASNPSFNIPDTEDERSLAGKFISKTFREKFLRERTPADTPLKGYEIAEAGVAGLNKLLGWQMALEMKNDGNGQPKSIYFSSKILKVNAPVKKRETQQ